MLMIGMGRILVGMLVKDIFVKMFELRVSATCTAILIYKTYWVVVDLIRLYCRRQ
ncbi:hypothetical protein Hanom_Chr00s089998g01798481 [Helianthus anomalus]